MESPSGLSRSLWFDHESVPAFAPLLSSPEVDVCVIGAGISGLTTAYLLLKAGKSVIVLERNSLAGGDTGRTTAHLSPLMDDGLSEMVKWHGKEGAKKVYESHSDAIALIEKIIQDEKIDCGYSRLPAYLWGKVDAEFQAAKLLDIPVSKIKGAPIEGFDTGPALEFPEQAQFHVVQYLRKLALSVILLGGKIYTDTPVTDVEWAEVATVKTESRHRVKAKFVVEASNSLVTGSMRTITKLYPYRTFVVAGQIPRGEVPHALFWDTEDPYHYVRLQPGDESTSTPDLLIIGGEDHKTGQENDADDRYRKLEAWARKRWPKLAAITHRWSGQVLETPDGLALIGQNPGNPENSFLITGDSGHGITHGTLGAMITRDLILERENPYAELYSPSRASLKTSGTWLRENLNAGKQYLDWITPQKDDALSGLPSGEGTIVKKGVERIAVYRAEDGKLSACSAVCPHLGGIVRWNSGEKTWDCPCHGSRFDRHGRAIATPTVTDLAPKRVPAES
ncbi:MAG: FAD-dependent oxidoreductase [Cryobacterium sp.]|nr:FAD-dependent oxidoreductase [Oligoflexia bacterium]